MMYKLLLTNKLGKKCSGSSKITNHVKGHFSRRLFKGVKLN